jgi:hypothetical protein
MNEKYVTRQEMADEAGLCVKSWLKKVLKLGIELEERARISPAKQKEIKEKMYGKSGGS